MTKHARSHLKRRLEEKPKEEEDTGENLFVLMGEPIKMKAKRFGAQSVVHKFKFTKKALRQMGEGRLLPVVEDVLQDIVGKYTDGAQFLQLSIDTDESLVYPITTGLFKKSDFSISVLLDRLSALVTSRISFGVEENVNLNITTFSDEFVGGGFSLNRMKKIIPMED